MSNHQREEVRNRLLRRVDWRFLLAQPQPSTVVCLCTGELREALRQLPVTLIESTAALANSGCDLAVLTNPHPSDLTTAAAALRPGGSCYVEWRDVPLPDLRNARRLLEQAGLARVVFYSPSPEPIQTASRWIPLGARGPVHHLNQSRRKPRNLLRRVGRARHRLLQRPGVKSRGPGSLCAITSKPRPIANGPARSRSEVGELREYLQSRWAGWGLGKAPRRLWISLLAGGSHSLNKVVALVFAGNERSPRLVIKYPRSAAALPGLLREADNLRTLGVTSRISGVPGFVFLENDGPMTALGETAVNGVPLDALVTRKSYRTYAQLGTDWLIQLAEKGGVVPQSVWEERLLDPVLADFESSFGPVLDRRLLRESESRLRDVGPMPIVWEQRDFAPWNLLDRGSAGLGVLDWESAEPAGLPALDLVYFLTYMALRVDRAEELQDVRASYRRSLDHRTFTGAVARQMLDRYATRLSLNLQALGNLRLIVWMLHSRSDYRRMVADVGADPGPDELRKSVFLALWEEDLRGLVL